MQRIFQLPNVVFNIRKHVSLNKIPTATGNAVCLDERLLRHPNNKLWTPAVKLGVSVVRLLFVVVFRNENIYLAVSDYAYW